MIRQDAALVLIGQNRTRRSLKPAASIFEPESRMVFTRVAGVSCSPPPFAVNGIPAFRIWFDNPYGRYLFETPPQIIAISAVTCGFRGTVSCN